MNRIRGTYVEDRSLTRPTDQQPLTADEARILGSEELFAGQRVLLIEHAGSVIGCSSRVTNA